MKSNGVLLLLGFYWITQLGASAHELVSCSPGGSARDEAQPEESPVLMINFVKHPEPSPEVAQIKDLLFAMSRISSDARSTPRELRLAAKSIATPATVNTTISGGDSLLLFAITEKDYHLAEYFLSQLGADPNVDHSLQCAVVNDDRQAVKLLLKYGANPNHVRDDGTVTSTFWYAATGLMGSGCVEVVQAFIDDKKACPYIRVHQKTAKEWNLSFAERFPEEKEFLAGTRMIVHSITLDLYKKYSQLAQKLEQYEQEHDAAGGCEHCRE